MSLSQRTLRQLTNNYNKAITAEFGPHRSDNPTRSLLQDWFGSAANIDYNFQDTLSTILKWASSETELLRMLRMRVTFDWRSVYFMSNEGRPFEFVNVDWKQFTRVVLKMVEGVLPFPVMPHWVEVAELYETLKTDQNQYTARTYVIYDKDDARKFGDEVILGSRLLSRSSRYQIHRWQNPVKDMNRFMEALRQLEFDPGFDRISFLIRVGPYNYRSACNQRPHLVWERNYELHS